MCLINFNSSLANKFVLCTIIVSALSPRTFKMRLMHFGAESKIVPYDEKLGKMKGNFEFNF